MNFKIRLQGSILALIAIIFFPVIGCEKDTDGDDAIVDIAVPPPNSYSHPAGHPNGELICYNFIPIAQIHTENNRSIGYSVSTDSLGFWLLNTQDLSRSRVLNDRLLTPSWSNDGRWLVFSYQQQIHKMFFDGNKFDTSSIVRLTGGGRNFFPSYSPDGKKILFDSSFGDGWLFYIGMMSEDGTNIKRIDVKSNDGLGRDPDWGKNGQFIYLGYTEENHKELFLTDTTGNYLLQITNDRGSNQWPCYSLEKDYIAYISNPAETPGTYLKVMYANTYEIFYQVRANVQTISWLGNYKLIFESGDSLTKDHSLSALWIFDVRDKTLEQITRNYPEYITH